VAKRCHNCCSVDLKSLDVVAEITVMDCFLKPCFFAIIIEGILAVVTD